ncbi:uncharacterized protein BDV14DRAFT_169345 [Aspergillus stella-maris]|uniref:uncharacterized protein n=1 Tax=Aspergillus stella-maris TaxID=1810926 RepID=UPI003CCD03F4
MSIQTPSDDPTQLPLWSKLASDIHTYFETYYLTPQTPSSHTQKIITNFSDPAITIWMTSAILLGVTISLPQMVPLTNCLRSIVSNSFCKKIAIALFLIPGILVGLHVLWMLDTIASIVIILWTGELVPSTAMEVLQLCYYLTVTVAMGSGWCWFVVWMYRRSWRVLVQGTSSTKTREGCFEAGGPDRKGE